MKSFFERVLPEIGPYCLVSGPTGPDGKLLNPRHLNGIKTIDDLCRQVQELSLSPVNIFFAVGSYAGANRQVPTAKRCLYLDLDSKDFDSVEDAIQKFGQFVKATGLPPPSIYVHSGRGIHVYWVLDRDVPIHEWGPVAAALKAKCLELGFPADKTVTADPARILRVPGTLNRKESVPLTCRVLSDNGTTCSLERIAQQLAVVGAPGQETVSLSGGLAKLAGLVSNEDLSSRSFQPKTEDQVRELLDYIDIPETNGRDEWITVLCAVQDWSNKSDEGFEIFHDWSATQPKYVSREDCWRTWSSFQPGGGIGIGTLIRLAKEGGYEDEQPEPVPSPTLSLAEQVAAPLAAALVAPNAGAPAPTVVQQIIASPLMYAASHVVRASGKSRLDINEAVRWLSMEFVTITDQDGLFYSMTNRAEMTRPVIDDLLTRYMPLNSNGVPTNASVVLRRHGTVNSVNSLGFFPGAAPVYLEEGLSYVNTYRNPPDMLPATPNEIKLIEDFWNYCFPREEDKAFGQYLKQTYAHVVQKPDVKIASAPLLVSKEFGTGKTTLAYNIPRALVGVHSAKMVSNKVLRSSFSDYLTGTHLIHFDEVHINGKWDSDDTANSMKNLVTGDTIEVHPKGQKPFNIPNRVFITATSNYEDAITLPSDDERRWGVYYLRPTRGYTVAQKKAYFGLLHRFLSSSRGPGVLRWYFSQVDITSYDPQEAPPTTVAKRAMIDKSQAPEVQDLKVAIANGDGPFSKDLGTIDAVRMYLHSQTGKSYSERATTMLLKTACHELMEVGQMRNGGQSRVRPWVWRNTAKWAVATTADIAAELKS